MSKMGKISKHYFDFLCRTCMLQLSDVYPCSANHKTDQQWWSILEEIAECDSINIAELISTTIPKIKVQISDKLPKKICHECLRKLKSAYRFQKICLQSNQLLHELIANREEQLKTTMSKALVGDALPTESILKEEFIDCRDEDSDIQGDTEYVKEITVTPQSTATDPLQSFSELAVSGCVKNEPCDVELIIERSNGESSKIDAGLETTEKESMTLCSSLFSCLICNRPFKNRGCLKMHLNHHKNYSVEQHYKTDITTASTEKEHVNVCTSTLTCSLCNKSFKKRIYLQRHLKRNKKCAQQQNQQPYRFKCDICHISLLREESLRLHRLRRHTQANKESRYICEVCEKTYDSGIALAKHYKYKHSENQPQEDQQKKKNQKPRNKLKNCRFRCDTCNRSFLKEEFLRLHRLRRHTKADKESRYPCEKCKKTFSSGTTLALHDKYHHSEANAQKYVCKFCKKDCKYGYGLTSHLRTHTGERPYLCPECGKSFTSMAHLHMHRVRHTEVKSLECPFCPKMFRCSSDLSRHKLIHRKNKPYVCDICGYKTAESHQLTKHKRYHSGEKPHKCEYCEMRFVRADQQRRHMRIHTGEKPYKCKYCERAFAQGNELIKHLRCHLGDNVYRCELCPLGFRLARDLRAHFTTHKNDDEETRERNMKDLREEDAKLELKLSVNKNAKTVENLEESLNC